MKAIAIKRLAPRRVAAAAALAVLLGGMAADCVSEGGMVQGGGDDSPRYVRVVDPALGR